MAAELGLKYDYLYVQYMCVYAGHETGQCRLNCCIFKMVKERDAGRVDVES